MTIMRCGQFYKEAMNINMVIFVLDLMAWSYVITNYMA